MTAIKRIKTISILSMIVLCVVIIKTVISKDISSVDDFQNMVKGYGIAGPIVLTVFQAFQVIIPVLPGYVGCAAGALSYGVVVGFICNYVGISLGSIGAFLLAEKYGVELVTQIFSSRYYEKWKSKISKKQLYERFLFMATLLPLFPDDFLCYFSGLIKMDRKKFIKIIILGKPWCILVYSIIFGMLN